MVDNLPTNAEDVGLIHGLGISPGGGNGKLLQYSCLENSTDRRAWWAAVHEAAKSWTWLSILPDTDKMILCASLKLGPIAHIFITSTDSKSSAFHIDN